MNEDIHPPLTFRLIRTTDVSGTSGTGHVADGVQFPDGTCVLRWRTAKSSTAVYASHADLMAIHGHDGATVCEWTSSRRPECCAEARRAATDGLVRLLIRQALGPFGKLTGREFAAVVASGILATEPSGVSVEEVAALGDSAERIAARLNGPSPAEVAALLRTIEWSGGDNCGEDVCPYCFADKHPGGDHAKAKHEPDCKLAAMIKQCEGSMRPETK